jgi:hypothetical protein
VLYFTVWVMEIWTYVARSQSLRSNLEWASISRRVLRKDASHFTSLPYPEEYSSLGMSTVVFLETVVYRKLRHREKNTGNTRFHHRRAACAGRGFSSIVGLEIDGPADRRRLENPSWFKLPALGGSCRVWCLPYHAERRAIIPNRSSRGRKQDQNPCRATDRYGSDGTRE